MTANQKDNMKTTIRIIRSSNPRALRADVRRELPRIEQALRQFGAYEITTPNGTALVVAR